MANRDAIPPSRAQCRPSAAQVQHRAPTPREYLREATSASHDAVELQWVRDDAFQSLSDYLAFLTVLHRVHIAFGRPAAIARNHSDDICEEDCRIDALCADLHLGEGLTHPLPATCPAMAPAYAWGVGYVLNGSALGAAILLGRQGVRPDWPSSYLSLGRSYAQTGKLKQFFDRLNTIDLDPAAMVMGARDTFALFGDPAPGVRAASTQAPDNQAPDTQRLPDNRPLMVQQS
jgi:heme oxygenase